MSARTPSHAMGFVPGGRIDGEVRVPGSKSLAQRLLVATSLCGGVNRITGLPRGAGDVEAALSVARACAEELVELASAAVSVRGNPPGPSRGWAPAEPLALGESGTLARLVLAALALCGRGGGSYALRPSGTLARRSSPALVETLLRAGVPIGAVGAVDGGDPRATFALAVRPLGPPSELELVDPRSSQEASALLLALAAYPDTTALVVRGAIPSRPYLAMTIALLERFGVRVESAREGVDPDGRDVERFEVRGPLRAREEPWLVEPDASSAAVALAAACISGGSARVRGLGAGSTQGDVRVVEHLAAFGCAASVGEDWIEARGLPARGTTLDLEREPDTAPVLASVAASVALRGIGASELRGLGTLPGKESSRIEVLADGLLRAGLAVEHGRDFLRVAPGRGASDDAIELDPRGDHRMAFAFALLGLARPNVTVVDPECVAKSWPSFWRDLERAGARLAASRDARP